MKRAYLNQHPLPKEEVWYMNKRRRISFSQYDAAHLYDLALEHFCVSKEEGVCHLCLALKTRLEKFIGAKEVKYIRKQNKKHPYSK